MRQSTILIGKETGTLDALRRKNLPNDCFNCGL
jgi:hypothetical protein